jgi:XTP/dITP diphosphohydrolase
MMLNFVAATNNMAKLVELKAILERFNCKCESLTEAGIESDPEEKGATFEENSATKAYETWIKSGKSAIADDSGLEVDALFGAPGVYSARYGGEGLSDLDRVSLLLKNMEGVPEGKRSARFVCAICALLSDGRKVFARGVCEGYILREPKGLGGFGYDPVFYSPELGKSFAEASAEEKNAVSHRGKALAEFAKKLEELRNEGLI